MTYHSLSAIDSGKKKRLSEKYFQNARAQLKSCAANIYTNNTADEIFSVAYTISNIFSNLEEGQIKKLSEDQIIFEILINGLSNPKFITLIGDVIKVADSKRSLPEYLPQHQFIKLILYTAVIPLACSLPYLNAEQITMVRKKFNQHFNRIRDLLSEDIDHLSLCGFLYTVNSEHAFHHKGTFRIRLDATRFFKNQSLARLIMSCMLHATQGPKQISERFKKLPKILTEDQDRNIEIKAIGELAKLVNGYSTGFEYFIKKATDETGKDRLADHFVASYLATNDSHIYSMFKIFLSGLGREQDTKEEQILEFLNGASDIKIKLHEYAAQNFKAYQGVVEIDVDKEWANKIHLVTYKTASAFETISKAVDKTWKIGAALFEFRSWVSQIHEIINRYEIIDDWEKVSRFVSQENNRIEWKSTFFISTEGPYISEEVDRSSARQTLQQVTRAMLGMMNTDGGTILVGLVENPQKIVRDDAKSYLIRKNRVSFLDAGWELNILRRKLDDVKQQITDSLKDQTLLTADSFNDLWSIQPLILKTENESIIIHKINVAPSDKFLFSAKNENGAVTMALVRRANGRTINIDPRPIIGTVKNNLSD